MARNEFLAALKQVSAERGIKEEVVLDTLKLALIAAYRKDYGESEDLTVEIDSESGEATIFKEKKNVTPPGFGRIAAQTAKQIILQKIREAEKNAIIEDFRNKIGVVVSGLIQRFEGPNAIVDLGKTSGIMPPPEQVRSEKYRVNQRLKVVITKIKEGKHGAEVVVSRADKTLVERLFELEVPEIHSGAVEIAEIAREAGSRSKVAVKSNQEGVDPIGSCVGQKGVRVQAVTRELFDEKIDLVNFSDNEEKFVVSSLSPARVSDVKLNKKSQKAIVYVDEDQLSLAIGKEGQNVRLAAKLTGWKIDIKQVNKDGKAVDVKLEGKGKEKKSSRKAKKTVKTENELIATGLSKRIVNILEKSGITTLESLKNKKEKELSEIKGLGEKAQGDIAKLLQSEAD